MPGIPDVLPQAATGVGGMALLVYAVRIAMNTDRPLRHGLDEIQKRLNAERARGDEQDKVIDDLREKLRDALDTAAAAAQTQQSLARQLEHANIRVEELLTRADDLGKEVRDLRVETQRLRGQQRR
jgi:chromosome segregation ATPase